MLVKIHIGTRYVVAICDADLVGKKFTDNDGLREIDLSGTFFNGEKKSEEEVKEIIFNMKREDASFNIVGNRACALALDEKIISEDGISKISNISIALGLL